MTTKMRKVVNVTEENNDLLAVAEPVNTVRLCTNLTDREVKE
jgi:hypothetical protein